LHFSFFGPAGDERPFRWFVLFVIPPDFFFFLSRPFLFVWVFSFRSASYCSVLFLPPNSSAFFFVLFFVPFTYCRFFTPRLMVNFCSKKSMLSLCIPSVSSLAPPTRVFFFFHSLALCFFRPPAVSGSMNFGFFFERGFFFVFPPVFSLPPLRTYIP